uniref:Uncharacterized protein n=1 Tax=Rhizophora mucronata TaxID=61149 RepID=A0A2P2QQ69_RHIMU
MILKHKSPHVTFLHCCIHHYLRASKDQILAGLHNTIGSMLNSQNNDISFEGKCFCFSQSIGYKFQFQDE